MKQSAGTHLLRWIAVVTALAVLFSLAGCSKPASEETGSSSTAQADRTTAEVPQKGPRPEDSSSGPEETVSTLPSGPDPAEPLPVSPSGSSEPLPAEPGTEAPTDPPVTISPIDAEGLKTALENTLRDMPDQWQVMVIDPSDGREISVVLNCEEDEWMTANYMSPVFLMAAAMQRVADETLSEYQVLKEATTMIVRSDKAAAGRLVDLVGGDNPLRGRERVKAYAKSIGLDLGFNPSETRPDNNRSFIQARYGARILRMMVRGELVSPEASEKMLEILLSDRVKRSEIDLGLDGEVRYGFINDVEDDVCVCTMGVVCLPARSFVICAVCNKASGSEFLQMQTCKQRVADLVNVTFSFFAD